MFALVVYRSSKPVPPSPLSTCTNILEHREQDTRESVSEIVLDQDMPDSSDVVATDSYFDHEPMQCTINAEYTDEYTDENTVAEYTIVACEGGVVWDAVYSQLFKDGSIGEKVLLS